ncbi:hypothetical protein C8Q80DRAFT_1342026 [Daedaleopsis nitida]|nr:hypothetical protein C8Q80DRAFT_1342026 [Daedaleopsis nitida]
MEGKDFFGCHSFLRLSATNFPSDGVVCGNDHDGGPIYGGTSMAKSFPGPGPTQSLDPGSPGTWPSIPSTLSTTHSISATDSIVTTPASSSRTTSTKSAGVTSTISPILFTHVSPDQSTSSTPMLASLPSTSGGTQSSPNSLVFPRSLSHGAIAGAVIGGAALLVAIAILFFYIGGVRARRKSSQVAIASDPSVRASPYNLAAEGCQPTLTVQECAGLGLPAVAPTATAGLQELAEPTGAARPQKDRTRFDMTGTASGGPEESREDQTRDRVAGGDQLRQAHDGGVRLAGGPLDGTSLNPDMSENGAPSTAPPPYQQY